MPEIVRATGGRLNAQPRRRGFLAAAAAVTLAPGTASAQTEMLNQMLGLHHLDVYFDAFADLVSVLERVGISPPVSAPASAPATGPAGQIPAGAGAVPATSPAAAVPAAPAVPASGAAQIPTK